MGNKKEEVDFFGMDNKKPENNGGFDFDFGAPAVSKP